MRRRLYALAATGAALAFALAACSSGAGQSGAASGGSTEMPLSDINPQPRDALKEGGELHLAMTSMPVNWNFLATAGNLADSVAIMGAYLLPANLEFAEDGSYTANPDYLESFEVKDAEGDQPQTVTLKLNPNAKWNSGRSITWEDVAAYLDACNGQHADYQCATTVGYDQVASVEKGADDFEAVITFKTAYPDWSGLVSTTLPKEALADAQAFNTGWEEPHNEWTAGPYIFDTIDPAQKTVTLVANPNWWGNKPLLDKVTLRVLDTAATPTAFVNKELDVMDNISSGDQYAQALKRSDAEIRSTSGLQWRHFLFNSESTILSDKAVRQALVKGINRSAIAASALAGIGGVNPADQVLNNHFFMPGQKGYQDNATKYAYNPEQAGKELDAAGWTLNSTTGIREKDGKPLSLNFATITGISTSENEAQLFQSDMKNIGVDVKLVAGSGDAFFSDVVPNGKYDVTAFAFVGNVWPLGSLGQLYGCGQALAKNGGTNYSNYCDPELEKLIPQIDVEMDSAKRIELANEADKMIWDDVMIVPTYRRPELVAVPKDLANYGAFGFMSTHMENTAFMQ